MKIQPSEIRWENPKLKKSFYKLKKIDPILFKNINSALDSIEENAFCSIQLPKRLCLTKNMKDCLNIKFAPVALN